VQRVCGCDYSADVGGGERWLPFRENLNSRIVILAKSGVTLLFLLSPLNAFAFGELLFFDSAQRKDNQKKGRFPDQS
jgi:hypothetical protein